MILYRSSNIFKSKLYSFKIAVDFLNPIALPSRSQIYSTLDPSLLIGVYIVLNSKKTFLNLFTFIAPDG